MININEIRVGNILLMQITDDWQVRPIKVNEFLALSEHPYWARPLEISEEILLKCGFEKTKTAMRFDIEYIDYRMGQFVLFILPKGKVEVEFCASHNKIEERGYLKTIEHLHQLQNLYFALTGQELNTSGL